MIIVYVAIGVVVLLGLWAILAYNKLVALREAVKNGWAQIDVLLKRRHDLIPNLVETVKGYASHERETLENVIRARNQAVQVGPGDVSGQMKAEAGLAGALRQLFAVAEAYPNLKADANFRQLQDELSNTENQIARGRSGYNDLVQRLNTSIQSFPTNLLAGPFGFREMPFFEVDEPSAREAPKVQF